MNVSVDDFERKITRLLMSLVWVWEIGKELYFEFCNLFIYEINYAAKIVFIKFN